MLIRMQLYIKPMCIHKYLFLHFVFKCTFHIEHTLSAFSLLILITVKLSLVSLRLCYTCKWDFSIHNLCRRPNYTAQPYRMFPQKGFTGGAFCESVNIWGARSGNGERCRGPSLAMEQGYAASLVCKPCVFLYP